MQFKNYYSVYVGGNVQPSTLNDRRTRGGPLTRDPWSFVVFGGAASDSRRPLVLGVEGFTWRSEAGREAEVELEVEWKPASNIGVSFGPAVTFDRSQAQWIDAFDDPVATETFGRRYVFGTLDQTTIAANLRLNWTFTPRLSLQLFTQPLLSVGDYADFKQLAAPRTYTFDVFGQDAGTIRYDADGERYVVDPDGEGPASTFAFDEPDFNIRSLRGTVVLRWEFRPGSTLYLVWTQTREASEAVGRFDARHDVNALLDAPMDNIFAVKMTYWLSR